MTKYYWCVQCTPNQSFRILNVFWAHTWTFYGISKIVDRAKTKCAYERNKIYVLFAHLIISVIANSFEIHSFVLLLWHFWLSRKISCVFTFKRLAKKGTLFMCVCSVRRENQSYYTTQNSLFFSFLVYSLIFFPFFSRCLPLNTAGRRRTWSGSAHNRTRAFILFMKECSCACVRWISIMNAGRVTDRN